MLFPKRGGSLLKRLKTFMLAKRSSPQGVFWGVQMGGVGAKNHEAWEANILLLGSPPMCVGSGAPPGALSRSLKPFYPRDASDRPRAAKKEPNIACKMLL